ncbi:hypothetical protein O1611_g8065 [Lasiodiplodia mahajangana]|uniref:Uncharacterized protein n=1 Tax=Lasiodiplodia mahajangana TaxID=1108764 RepID=A0ACC2JEF7_9PEZI|nr:hypothetical protein O1611_g8065 [Lasiodiplodia mahajangana]
MEGVEVPKEKEKEGEESGGGLDEFLGDDDMGDEEMEDIETKPHTTHAVSSTTYLDDDVNGIHALVDQAFGV